MMETKRLIVLLAGTGLSLCFLAQLADLHALRSAIQARRLAADAATVNATTALASPDTQMPGCTPGKECVAGNMPAGRGICVKSGFTEECWDVCNGLHPPTAFTAGETPAMNSALAGMVASVRQGLNSYVQCPQSLVRGDVCVPGRKCSQEMSQSFNVPAGQGLCVIDASQPNSRACRDMCDFKYDPVDFTTDTASGVGDQVQALRNSHVCPSNTWWFIKWILAALAVIVLLCLLAVCLNFISLRSKKNKSSGTRLEAQPEFNQDFLAPGPDEKQFDAMAPQDFGGGNDYHGDPRDMSAVPNYDSRDMRQDSMLPPEPPRMDAPHMQGGPAWEDSYQQPPVEPRQNPDLLAPESPSQSYMQDPMRNAYVSAEAPRQAFSVPGSGSMRIPGLNEPQLLPGAQTSLGITGPAVQMTPPDLLSQALPMSGQGNPFINAADPLGMSQPNGAFAGTSFPNTFQTQIPTTFATQPPMSYATSPPSSIQFQPGAAQPFFTQLARR